VQVALVALLEAGLADVVGAPVVGGVVALLDALEVAVVDAADVADHVGGEAAHRIVAEQARLQLDAGKAVALGDEAGHLFVGEPVADRQGLEALALVHQLLEARGPWAGYPPAWTAPRWWRRGRPPWRA
jgi:hypothetical protein